MVVVYWVDYVHALTSKRTGVCSPYNVGEGYSYYLEALVCYTGQSGVSESLWIVPGTIGE